MSRKNQKVKRSRESRIEKQEKKEFKKVKVKKEKGPIRRFLSKALLLIFLVFLIIAGWFCFKTYQNGWGLKGALMTVFNTSQDEIDSLEPINILLLGISEDLNTKLTDTIIVCSYSPKDSKVSMVSIPRDTFVGDDKLAAKSSDKLNVLFNKNKDKMLKKVSEIVGVNIKYYAVVNNEAVIKIVDIIGGVVFDVPIDMDYDDPTQDLHIHLKKGTQRIYGNEAEQLLRFRHNNDGSSYPANYGDNDYGRMRTQREFIEATLKQSINVFNVIKSRKIYNTIIENVETNYDINTLKKYIPTLADFNFDNISSYQIPGKSEQINEKWFFVYDSSKTKELIKELNIK